MTRTIGGIGIEELSKFDAERDWVKMNNAVCGHDFERNDYDGFGSTDKIVIIPECDIKKFIIKRTDHEDLVINVNGGTYRND